MNTTYLIEQLLDHVTDVAAIIAITYIVTVLGTIDIEVITAITSIAIGQRYAKGKWMNKQNS